jgi:hypothetical protein
MGKLEEILFKYQGDETILCPFVSLLRCLAEKGISPSSFAAYVILPRMKEDYNWRKWEENHLKALWIIAGVLIAAKGQPPFNQENIGSAYSRLSRDIVLSKYVGKTLAQYQLYQLCYTDALNAYRQAWQKISLNNFLSIYFIRLNILHFVYAMSGKIDMAQLIAIIEQLPDIEQSFASAFPQNITFDQFKKIQNINLFNHDIDTELQARRRRGYHRLDFALEIKAYLEITKVLLEKNTGVYLCAYYTRILKRFKDPAAANVIVRLVRVIDDRDGMHIYKWHTKKLLQKSKEDMPPYVDFIEEHGGCDPEYPQIHLIFRDEEAAHEES